MNALVTGGAGFIGSNLVRLLVHEGFSVRVLDDLSTGFERNLHGVEVDFVLGDVCDEALVESSAEGTDVIFHLAASVGRQKSLEQPQRDAIVNLVGTTSVLEAARKQGVQRFVYSSSAAIYGELITMPIAEDHPLNPDSPYGVSKLAGEKQGLCYSSLYGMIVICLRYFNVYGVNQRYDAYGNVIPIFADRLQKRIPITIYGDGLQTRDFVNVKDVAMANFLAGTIPTRSGSYNLGSGTTLNINTLAETMMDLCGIRVPIEYASERPADVKHCRADISQAARALGFKPTLDMRAGLDEYLAWFMREAARE